MMLATMVMVPERLSVRDIERLAKPLTYYKLMDELVFNVVVKSAHVDALRVRRIDSPEEMLGRAGWNLLTDKIMKRDSTGLDLDAILKTIEAEILSAPKRKQHAMNHCLVEIGVHFPEFTQKCIAVGERLGRFDQTPVPKGCVSSYTPEWIAAALERRQRTG